MKIETAVVSAPVTALVVQKNHILAGEASFLHVYNLTTGKHLNQYCLLGSHIIHGIRKGDDCLYAVFGQKAISIVHMELEQKVRLNILCGITEFADWILDVALLGNSESASCYALVLAHNSAILWDWKQKACLQHVHCAENCILYSAKLIGNSWAELTIAAGTVFNQVVLWKPTGPKDTGVRVPVQRRLSGHQGIIFNLSYHHDRRLLCSVSDDRSIRLWHLDLTNTPKEQSEAAHMTLYGHSARVWDAKILDHSIVSVGEDATCCVWNSSGDVVNRFTGHKGRSIWSLAVHKNQKLIVTGGGDSSIRVWPVDIKQEERITTEELDIQNAAPPYLLKSLESTSASCGSETLIDMEGFNPRQLAVLNLGKIIVLTLNGCLLCYTLRSKQWELLSHDPNYQSCLLSVCPSHQIAALGNIKGRLKIVALDNGKTLLEVAVFTGKVFSLYWENEDNLLVSGPDGVVIWLNVKKSSSTYCVKETARFQLPHAPQQWLTTATLVPHEEGALVCGDRRGSLLLYTQPYRTKDEEEPVGPTHTLPYIHGKCGVTQVCHHSGCIFSTGRDGTYRQYRIQDTRLHVLNTYKVYKGFNWIESISFTAADDILVTGFHASSFIIWSRHSNEKLVQIQCGGGHRAWGFATCKLRPISVGDSYSPTSGDCSPTPGDSSTTPGDCSPTPGDEDFASIDGSGGTLAVFACIKAKKIIVCTAPGGKLQQHRILKESLHGRRVTCIKYLTSVNLPKGECAVCAMGSEDNAVNIVAIMFPVDKPSRIHILHRLQVHISSVRCLATCPALSPMMNLEKRKGRKQVEVNESWEIGQRLLLFSVGGRRAIQCWRVTVPKNCPLQDQAPGWLKSSCTVEHLASYGNIDNVKQQRWLKRHGHTIDPETRFMSVSMWMESELIGCQTADYMLGVAGSDACLRLFAFREQTKQLFPLISTNSQGCCLLTTLCVMHDFPCGTSPILLTAGTNGKIAFWDIKKALKECGKDGKYCIEGHLEHTQKALVDDEDEVEQLEMDPKKVEFKKSIAADGIRKSFSNVKTCSNTKKLNSTFKTPGIDAMEPCKHVKEQFNNSNEPCSTTLEPFANKEKLCSNIPTYTLYKDSIRTMSNHQDIYEEKTKPLPSLRTAWNHGIAETDASWDNDDFGRILLSLKAHQSGINALSMIQLDSKRYLLASGGDDNCIQLSLLSISCTESDRSINLSLEHTYCITCAHATQVTGLSFIDAYTLISSSIDQRLNIWSITVTSDKTSIMKVELLESRLTLIADCAGMAHWKLKRHGVHAVAVCGQGVQILHLTESPGTRPETSHLF